MSLKPDKIIKVFSEEETSHIEKEWIATFCKKKEGVNIRSYKWHIFSSKKFPSLEGDQAKEEYQKHSAVEYIILPNDFGEAILTSQRPVSCDLQDYYVFPRNMAWTMAFTHEEGWMGPYFARHENYEALNMKNEKEIDKNKQIEIAKQKGWI